MFQVKTVDAKYVYKVIKKGVNACMTFLLIGTCIPDRYFRRQ
jgi:hypothetical protein